MGQNNTRLSSVKIGPYILPNYLVMSPKSNFLAYDGIPPLKLINYYAQLSRAGLIVTEPTTVVPLNREDSHIFGIYSREQLKNWRKITEAVHSSGGKIFLQLWYGGLDLCSLDGEVLPTASNAVTKKVKSLSTNSYLNQLSISDLYQQFRRSAQNALIAEFDGVEIHLCAGHFIDRLVPKSSDEIDSDYTKYAEDVENRAQLLLGTIEAVANVIDEERVGVKISPSHKFLGFNDLDSEGTFYYIVDALNFYNLAYVHITEPVKDDLVIRDVPYSLARLFRPVYGKNMMFDADDNLSQAELLIASGDANLICCTEVVYNRIFGKINCINEN